LQSAFLCNHLSTGVVEIPKDPKMNYNWDQIQI